MPISTFQSEQSSKKVFRYMKPSTTFPINTGNNPGAYCIGCKQKASKIIDSLPDSLKETKFVKNPETKLMDKILVTPRPLINRDGFCPICSDNMDKNHDSEIMDLLVKYCGYTAIEAKVKVKGE